MQPEARDFFASPLTPEELHELIRMAGGVRPIFAFASPSFRKLGRPAESFGDEELAALILAEPRMLRRPLLVAGDGRVLAGARAVTGGG